MSPTYSIWGKSSPTWLSLDAKIVVWIAKGFRDEHLSAIRWLNEHISSSVRLLRRAGGRRANR